MTWKYVVYHVYSFFYFFHTLIHSPKVEVVNLSSSQPRTCTGFWSEMAHLHPCLVGASTIHSFILPVPEECREQLRNLDLGWALG